MSAKTIHEIVRQMELLDKTGTTNISKYVQVSMREDIEKTEAYLNSKHTSGETDSQGRKKPFFNIVLSARNIWFRATDLDRKNIRIKATKQTHFVLAFLATILFEQWMRKAAFGKFLNDWGLTLATHGSAITKFIEKDGELFCSVMDWNNMLVDAVDFDNNVKIEKLWFTPAQLKQNKNYNKALVKKLLDNLTPRQTMGGQRKDNKASYIPVYEVHGEMPLSFLTGKDKDEDEYVQQMQVITFMAKKDNNREFEDYTLFSGREANDPYAITHLLAQDGQTYAGGAVKNLFQAQWIINDTQKKIKDQLELASKIIFQTSDKSLVGQNILTNLQDGQILFWDGDPTHYGSPLTQLNNKPDIAAMQAFKTDWQSLSNQINGISEAMLGENPPSGTAWRQTRALLTESHSLFEIMTENKGLALEEMLRKYIIPHFKKKMDTTEEISAILEAHQIKQIDSLYVPNEAIKRTNRKIIDEILNNETPNPEDMEMFKQNQMQEIQQGLNQQGNQRFIKPSEISTKTWKEVLKDLEWELEVDITGEQADKQSMLETLNTMLATIAPNPAILNDPNVKLVFNKILNLTSAISPLELNQTASTPVMAAQAGGGLSEVIK